MPKPPVDSLVDFTLASLLAFVKVGNAVTFPEGVLMEYWESLKYGADSAGMPQEMLKHTVAFADTIAASVLKWSKGDNYAQTRSAEKYSITTAQGRWVPTPPAYGQALEPHWSAIRPLLLDSASQFLPPPPPQYNIGDTSSAFAKELLEVKQVGEKLSDEEKHIADFFDDNPFNLHVTGHVMYATKKFSPPGHWMNIVGIAAEKSGADFAKTVATYTATSIALFDGFIACWDAKYKMATARPETLINQHVDPAWRPYLQTPPFPSYISGHSVISSATAEILTGFYGDSFAYTDTSEKEFGIPHRSFRSFRHAAEEASLSRLYGGIHFRSDIVEGAKVGEQIGRFIDKKLHFNRNEKDLAHKR